MSAPSEQLNLTIVPATIDDLPQLMALENACFSDPWPEAVMRTTFEVSVAKILLAKLDGEAVGFAMAYLIPPEGEIGDVCVSPAHRGKGIGRALMDALIDGSGCTQFWLEVRASNSAARSLYEKLGFEVLGVRKNYYERPREDALVMGLTLSEE